MSNQKLTPAIAAAYWGAEIIDNNNHKWEMMGLSVGYRDGIEIEPQWLSFDQCWLLLSPLSSITDEHAIEVAKIVSAPWARHYNQSEITYQRVDVSKRIGVFLKGNLQHIVQVCGDAAIRYYNPTYTIGSLQGDLSVESRGEFCITRCNAAHDYLRSKSYDCGYGEIPSLIEAAIAIDKTKTTK